MSARDEPLFPARDAPVRDAAPGLAGSIRRLLAEQPYGVLCTQGEGQPYGSLVAFAFAPDLTHAVFATPVATRKYRLLSECDHVALVVDDRPRHADDMMAVAAVTATGRARQVAPGPEFDRCARLLGDLHPQLGGFFRAESCALFRIDVFRFFHVTRFQEVGQWVPPSR